MNSKKTNVKLPTFETWNLRRIGHKCELKEGVTYFSHVWCKVGRFHNGKLYQHHAVKGATKTAAERFVDGRDFVTKYSVRVFNFDSHCFFIRTKRN